MDDLKKETRQEIGEVKQMVVSVAKEMADMKGMMAKLVQQQISAYEPHVNHYLPPERSAGGAAVDQKAARRQMGDLQTEMRQEIGNDLAEMKQMIEKEMAGVKGLLDEKEASDKHQLGGLTAEVRRLRTWVPSAASEAAPLDQSAQAVQRQMDDLKDEMRRVHRVQQQVGSIVHRPAQIVKIESSNNLEVSTITLDRDIC